METGWQRTGMKTLGANPMLLDSRTVVEDWCAKVTVMVTVSRGVALPGRQIDG